MSGGYEDAEYLVNGVAKTYSGPATGPAQETGVEHRFATLLLTRTRSTETGSADEYSSSRLTLRGMDRLDVVWDQVATLLQSNGDAWVGVTVRSSAGDALRACDPERYAELDLVINDVEWDILRQVGTLLKQSEGAALIGGHVAARLYMAGYSQSAVDTATFAMALHGLSRTGDGLSVFDGYFPAAHWEA